MKKQQSLPTTASFHPKVIDQYVSDKILKGNPVTLFTPIIGLLSSGIGYAVNQMVAPWMVGLVIGGTVVGIGSLAFDKFVRKDAIRIGYLAEVNKQLEAQAQQLAEWLKNEFEILEHSQASRLLHRLNSHMEVLEDVLKDKFQPGTETYDHFHGVAEALVYETLNRLKDVASQIKVNQAVDLDNAPQSVLDGYENGQKRVEALLASAETAVAGIAELNQKVAAISSGNQKELSDFVQEVQLLAQRTSLYQDERTIN